MGRPISAWTVDRVAHLVRLHGQGLTCLQIAETMGGMTRNSVIGKCFRMGLTRAEPEPKQPRAPKTPSRIKTERVRIERTIIVRSNANSKAMRLIRTVVFEPMQLRCVEIVPRHVSLIDLGPGDCRYPYGDQTITFCGHPKQAGSSYCPPHHDLCWVKPQPQKDKYLTRAAA